MSSDDAYAAFLDKANEDPNAGRAKAADAAPSKRGDSHGATLNGVNSKEVPQRLITAAKDQFYVSDSDEPWVPVNFNLGQKDSLPTEGKRTKRHTENRIACGRAGKFANTSPDEFIKATGSKHAPEKITILDPVDWDSQGQYKPLIDELRVESKGNDVRVYRVQVDATRVEYWLVSTLNGNLLGYMAKAVES